MTSSNFYIEVFSRRYWQSIEAESAAKAEALLLKAERHRAGLQTDDSFDGLLSASSGGGVGGDVDDDGEGDEWVDEVDDSLEEEEDEDLEGSEGEGEGGVEAQGDNGALREKSKDV